MVALRRHLELVEQADGSWAMPVTGSELTIEGGEIVATIDTTDGAVLIGGYSPLVNVTPTLDTAAYAIGDVMFVTTLISAVMSDVNKTGVLQTIYLVDKADLGLPIDLYFFDANVSFGSLNGVPAISDADALNYIGHESVLTTDWKDLGGVRVAQLKNLGKVVKPVTGTANIYVAGVIQAVGTFAADSLLLRCGFLDD